MFRSVISYIANLQLDTYRLSLGIVYFCTVVLVGWIFKRYILKILSDRARDTKSHMDDKLIEIVSKATLPWSVMLGLIISLNILPLSPAIRDIAFKVVLSSLIVYSSWIVADLLSELSFIYIRESKLTLPAKTIFTNLIKGTVLILGLLILLQTLGISIAPVLTTLGVGGLAVALALQDTLSNFFAGIHIIVAGQIRVGDYIKLESGEEGYVVDVSWRHTTIRQLSDNIIIVPNSKLASSIVINHSLPQPAMNVYVNIGISYDSDLEHVERVTLQVAEEVQRELPGADKNFKPIIRYKEFGDFSINFTVVLRAVEFSAKFALVHEFIKRLYKRYREEGIEIPFPITTVYLKTGTEN